MNDFFSNVRFSNDKNIGFFFQVYDPVFSIDKYTTFYDKDPLFYIQEYNF